MAGYYRSGKLIAALHNAWDWLKVTANQQWPVVVPGGSHRAGVYQRGFKGNQFVHRAIVLKIQVLISQEIIEEIQNKLLTFPAIIDKFDSGDLGCFRRKDILYTSNQTHRSTLNLYNVQSPPKNNIHNPID